MNMNNNQQLYYNYSQLNAHNWLNYLWVMGYMDWWSCQQILIIFSFVVGFILFNISEMWSNQFIIEFVIIALYLKGKNSSSSIHHICCYSLCNKEVYADIYSVSLLKYQFYDFYGLSLYSKEKIEKKKHFMYPTILSISIDFPYVHKKFYWVNSISEYAVMKENGFYI